MSNNAKIVSVVVVVVLVVVAGWLFSANQANTVDQTQAQSQVAAPITPAPQDQNSLSQNSQATFISPTDTSDTGLTSDMTHVDAQLQGLATDATKADRTQ